MSKQLRLPIGGGLGRHPGLPGLLWLIGRPAIRYPSRTNHSVAELAEMVCQDVVVVRPLVDELIELGYVDERAGVLYRTSKQEPGPPF